MSIKQGGKTIAGATQYHPDLFDFKWADHILDDAQWLMANPFSWQYGSMYQAAYANLSDAITGKTLQSETVAGIAVQFYLADDGHKICPASEESNVLAIYNKTGNAWYYIIDTTNQRFKLPRRHSQQIVRSVKNADGSWYRLYADGWVEQGGVEIASGSIITLPIVMADTKYTVQTTPTWGTANSSGTRGMASYLKTTTSFGAQQDHNSGSFDWQVSGQSAIDISSFQDGEKYLYFYVGAFTQTAIENTAGLNTELFNQKADLNLSNTASNIDFVVESQEPTAANNYTWYRKYKSGWVEQGGIAPAGTSNISFPIEMADTNYCLVSTWRGNNTLHTISNSFSTTGCNLLEGQYSTSGRTLTAPANWQVSGIAA